MAPLATLVRAFLGLALVAFSIFGHAQLVEAPPIVLDGAETRRLREIVDKPVDTAQSANNRIEQHRAKEVAAVLLGDMAARERNLREWAQVDMEGAWVLRSYLASTERRAEAYEIGLYWIQKASFPSDKARISIYVAENYVEDGQLVQAARLLDSAQATLRTLPAVGRTGYQTYLFGDHEVLYHLVNSRFLWQSGRLPEAITAARRAVQKGRDQLKVESLTNDRHRMLGRTNYLRSLYFLATELTATGAHADAEEALREAYQALQKFGYGTNLLAGLYLSATDLYNASGAFKEALDFARKGDELLLKIGFVRGSVSWLNAQRRMVAALAGMDRWAEALAGLQAIDQGLAETGLVTQLARLPELRGMVYVRNGKPELARPVLQEALAWYRTHLGPDHHQTALAEGLLASALAGGGDAQTARPLFERALQHLTAPATLTGDMTETALDRKMKRFVLQGYAQVLAAGAATNPADAAALFQIADLLGASSVQQALAEAAVRSGVGQPGLAEIVRKEQDAKTELGVLTATLRDQGNASGPKLAAEVIAQMRARMTELETQRKGYKQQIQKSYPEYFQLIQPKAASPQDIARQLAEDELFLAIIPMETSVYVWAIQADGSIGFHRSELSERDLQRQVAEIRQTLDVAEFGAKAPRFNHARAHGLYQALFAPFDARINARKHLIVSTSGALAQLPFAVLPRTAEAPADPKATAWLIKDIAISHVPSASGWMSLKQLSRQPAAREPLLAWGDPLFDPEARTSGAAAPITVAARAEGDHARSILDPASFVNYSKLQPLPETRQEVTELATILGADPARDLVLGGKATRASVLEQSRSGALARKQVVVFATHGLLAGDLPGLTQPALAMTATRDPKDSPLLTLEDVLGLKLNADWVVLSACNTAGADGRAEEALSGLARGFFYAGSRSLLVTHWSVESESAMRLTTRTFQAYKANPTLRRAEALRTAMLDTLQTPQFAHPAFWAPYALVGEGGR